MDHSSVSSSQRAGHAVEVLPADDSIEFEGLLADLSATFINVPATEVNERIAAAAEQLVEFLGFDRTTVMEVKDGDQLGGL